MVDGVLLLVDASEGPCRRPGSCCARHCGPAADHPGDQQGGPAGRPDQGGRGRHLRAVPRPGRRRGRRSTSRSSTPAPATGQASLTQPADGSVPDSDRTWSRCSAPCWTPSRRPPTTTAPRCRPTSPTSTLRRSSVGSPCAGSARAPSARARPSPGAASTAAIERVTHLRAADDRGAGAQAGRAGRARATSSRSPASPTS